MHESNPFEEGKKEYCTFYVVRHGQTEYNVKKLAAGHADIPLTQEGVQQAQELARKISHIHFDAAFSSDLERAKQTAEIVALEHNLAVVTAAALREKNFGELDGKNQELIKQIYTSYNGMSKEQVAKYRMAPSAETDEEVVYRFITKLCEIAVFYKEKTVLIGSHGALMRAFLIHLGHGEYKNYPSGAIKNTAYIKVLSDGVDFYVAETAGIDFVSSGS